jgi:membrane-associated phospholipid phosphatase
MKRYLFICSMVFSTTLSSAELTGNAYWEGLKSSVTLLYLGSYEQFRAENNLYYAAAAVPSMVFSFREDDRLTNHARTKKISKTMQIASDLAPALSFPVIPLAFLTYGIKKDDNRATEFAKEFFATMYLALLESAAFSVIDIHERPDNDKSKLSKWETNFRGSSSFPSGHVIPYAALAFKTFQFYGPLYAAAPAALFVMTSIQRVRDGKHYFSDVVGAFFLTAFASEGVKKAGGFTENHPTYKFIFERNLQVGYIEHRGAVGPRISFNW